MIFELEKSYNILELLHTFDFREELEQNDLDITAVNGSQYHKGFVAAVIIKGELVVFQLTLTTVLFYIENIDDFGIIFTKDIIDSMFFNQMLIKTNADINLLKDKMLELFERKEEYETCQYILDTYNSIKNEQ